MLLFLLGGTREHSVRTVDGPSPLVGAGRRIACCPVSKPLAAPGGGYRETPSSVDEVLELVHARGGRATPSRRTLLELLFDADDHLSAEELAEAVQLRVPNVHLSTIYRNLEDLQRLGVIVHTHLGHGPATYQLASLAHAHLICSECGTTIEAPDQLFGELALTIRATLGFRIDPHHFAMLGRCAACERGGRGRGGGHRRDGKT